MNIYIYNCSKFKIRKIQNPKYDILQFIGLCLVI